MATALAALGAAILVVTVLCGVTKAAWDDRSLFYGLIALAGWVFLAAGVAAAAGWAA